MMGSKASKLTQEELKVLKAATYFDKKELQEWYIDFMTNCPSGYLTEDEFIRMCKQFFPFGDPSKFALVVFKVFDQNSDGCISFQEFVTALSITTRGTLDEKLEWTFLLYDVNRDGYITKDEMTFIVKSIYSITNLQCYCKMADAHQDQKMAEERADMIFHKMDQNQDGKLSLEEFREGFKCNQWILQVLTFDLPETEGEKVIT